MHTWNFQGEISNMEDAGFYEGRAWAKKKVRIGQEYTRIDYACKGRSGHRCNAKLQLHIVGINNKIHLFCAGDHAPQCSQVSVTTLTRGTAHERAIMMHAAGHTPRAIQADLLKQEYSVRIDWVYRVIRKRRNNSNFKEVTQEDIEAVCFELSADQNIMIFHNLCRT